MIFNLPDLLHKNVLLNRALLKTCLRALILTPTANSFTVTVQNLVFIASRPNCKLTESRGSSAGGEFHLLASNPAPTFSRKKTFRVNKIKKYLSQLRR